jgi:hypothetical protein
MGYEEHCNLKIAKLKINNEQPVIPEFIYWHGCRSGTQAGNPEIRFSA